MRKAAAPLCLLLAALGACGSEGGAAVADAGAADPSDAAPENSDAEPLDPNVDPALVAERLGTTLGDLADLPEKRCGTEGGLAAGDYVADRLRELGLEPTFESFTFPRWDRVSSALTITTDGEDSTPTHDVFAYSGAGQVTAEVVFLGTGRPDDYEGEDVTGKIVFVERNFTYHRSSQYAQAVAHGAAALLYASRSPENLIQIGTVTDPEDGLGAIPAVTVGSDDGDVIIAALAKGSTVTATIDVDATITQASGRNVIARFPGTDPSGAYLLAGAHYDTWFIGTMDNSTGVAGMLELARLVTSGPPRRLGVVFVAYDGEELGLFGGYDFLRKHVVVAGEPMAAFVNLEIPASGSSDLRAIGFTGNDALGDALDAGNMRDLYPYMAGMESVPALFGGIIPTDIQGMYWYGIPGFSTVCDTPYYHTTEDTPDKVDMPFFADSVLRLAAVLDTLDEHDPSEYEGHDEFIWDVALDTITVPDGLQVTATATDAAGEPQVGAKVKMWVDVDDFTRVFSETLVTDEEGTATVTVPTEALEAGAGARWLHVTAGTDYPLAEQIAPLP